MKDGNIFDDLDGLVMFDAIVRLGSLTNAARALGLPKATLSRRFASLEDTLGMKLMLRTTRSWSLTEAGRELHGRIMPHLAALQQAAGRLRDGQVGPVGLVRITAPAGFGQSDLVLALSEFLDEHPEVQVELVLHERETDLLPDGVDIAIRTGALHDTEHATYRLRDKSYTLVASPGYVAAHGLPRHLADLADHLLIAANAEGAGPTNLLGPDLPPMRWRLAVVSTAARHAAVRKGMGLALLPSGLVAEDIAEGRLVAITLQDAVPETRAMTLLHPREGARSEAVRALTCFLAERYGS